MKNKRFVIDTNVFVSALLFKGKPWEAVLEAGTTGLFLFSDAVFSELVEVVERPKFERYISEQDKRVFFTSLENRIEAVPAKKQIGGLFNPPFRS